jgi:hypothetical protein
LEYFCFADLYKLDGSKLVTSSTKTTARYKGCIIKWPYHIKCGLCKVERQVAVDRSNFGIISKFKTGMILSPF